ncbi:hypothetical protein FRC16_007418 [Serendipita sp. 398]|nr:hypothetical protein FRC16_007418 [Serendipita sp. 398]
MSNTAYSKRSRITILYFGIARTTTGTHIDTVDISEVSTPSIPASHKDEHVKRTAPCEYGIPLSRLIEVLIERHKGTKLREILDICQWSVDLEMTTNVEDILLRGGEEVGVIPPVSGG